MVRESFLECNSFLYVYVANGVGISHGQLQIGDYDAVIFL